MITIVDYGMGNLGSLANMLKRIGAQAEIVSDPSKIARAEKLILPGVGAFDSAMRRINETPAMRETLNRKVVVEQTPLLGVCLGMQLLVQGSEEGKLPGLGWIAGYARRFPRKDGLKVPHMGWNVAKPSRSSPLTADLGEEPRYYFVHSYYVLVDELEQSLMRTWYGLEYDSAIGRGNVFGVQFHPEKSHRFGQKILENFVKI